MKTNTLARLFALLSLLACKKETPPVTLSLNGVLETISVTLRFNPPNRLQKITATGQISGLGETTSEALSTLVLSPPPPFQLSGTSFIIAQGDTIFTTFTGTSTPTENGKLSVLINHTFSGGSGRYRNASGYMNGKTIADMTTPAGVLELEGRLSY